MAQTHKTNIEVRMKGANKAAKGAKNVSSGMSNLAKSAIKAGAAYFGTRGIINGLKASLNLFARQELAEKKLRISMGYTSNALLRQASALQKSTMFGDEAIIEAQALIAAFVGEESAIKAATVATLDLAAAKGMDLVVAADLVSKTLGSSTNAMSRYGIEVVGAVGSTQRLESLTSNISKVFGGQATEQTNTYTGSMESLSNAIGDIGEGIGASLAPAISKFANLLTGMIETPLSEEMKNDRVELNAMLTVLGKLNPESEERLLLIKQITEAYPEYVSGMDLEKATLEDINALRDENNEILLAQIRVQERQEQIEDLKNKRAEVALEIVNREIEAAKQAEKGLFSQALDASLLSPRFGPTIDKQGVSIEGLNMKMTELTTQILELTDEEDELLEKSKELIEVWEDDVELQKLINEGLSEELKIRQDLLGVYRQSTDWGLEKIEVDELQITYLATLSSSYEGLKKGLTSFSKEQVNASMAVGAAQKNLANAAGASATAFIIAELQKSMALYLTDAFAKFGIFGAILGAGASGIVGNLFKGVIGSAETVFAAEGYDGIVTEPTMFVAGESGAEYVDIDPLTNEGGGNGSGINITFSGNVMSQDFIEAEAIPMIKEALRKGGDIGIG